MDCKAVIGIYGVSGCGKSRLLSMLQTSHPEWRCLEGSSVIHSILKQHGEGLKDFHDKTESEKDELRNRAVKVIRDYPGVTIVAGHCSFPEATGASEADDVKFNDVFTEGDGETFDTILYLDKDSMSVHLQREQDNEIAKRARPSLSAKVLQQWIEHEKQVLQNECAKYNIQFELIQDEDTVADYISTHVVAPLATKVQEESTHNLREAVATIASADVFLLIDGDRTLCPMDTGKIFVDHVWDVEDEDPIKAIFKRYDSYTFQAFLEVAMFYANVMPTLEYKDVSQGIGSEPVDIHDEWIRFLTSLPPNVHAIVLTSGNREIWHAALDFNNLVDGISLLAGNHVGLHSYIVDSHAKAAVAKELRDVHGGCKILSFGDSAVDIPMLCASDEGYIVIDDRQNRSMKDFISKLVESRSAHHIHQISLLQDCSFRHDGIQVASLGRLLDDLISSNIHKVLDCAQTSVAARILATQSRRSDLNGPALQDVHAQIGQFLADKLLDEVGRYGLLTEQASFSHVQGTSFPGTVTCGNVLILPLMRGGEPMSRGVYQRFPRAKLIHYDDNDEGQSKNAIDSVLATCNPAIKHVIIVDSVINEGRSVSRALASLMKHKLDIFVLTAVMQHEASLKLPKKFPRVRFLALRVSDNKYTGKGGTDTGNRLFGTY